jgi:hypothetical protein
MNFDAWNFDPWSSDAGIGACAAPAAALVKYPARCSTFDLVWRGAYRPSSCRRFDFSPMRATATP